MRAILLCSVVCLAVMLVPYVHAFDNSAPGLWDAQIRKYLQESMENRFLGSAPQAGRNFTVWDYDVMDASGDGVLTKECLEYWMGFAMTVQMHQGNPLTQPNLITYCPFGAFGAVIVNAYDRDTSNPVDSLGNNCGKLMETNSGKREAALHNPEMHSEVNAIIRLTNCTLHPELCNANGNFMYAPNRAWWGQMYMFTTGASCAEDTGAEINAGFGTVVQGVTIADLLNNNWTQPTSWEPEVFLSTNRQTTTTNLIKNVRRDWVKQYFDWQFTNAAFGCPQGCVLNAAGTGCTMPAI